MTIKLKNEIFYNGFLTSLNSLQIAIGDDGKPVKVRWPGSVSYRIHLLQDAVESRLKPMQKTHADVKGRYYVEPDPIPEGLEGEELEAEQARFEADKKAADEALENNEEFIKEIDEIKKKEQTYDVKPIIFDFDAWEKAGKYYDVAAVDFGPLKDVIVVKNA